MEHRTAQRRNIGVVVLIGLLAGLAMLALPRADAAGTDAGGSASLEQQCIEAGLARPAVLHAPEMHRAGMRPGTPHHYYTQGTAGWFLLPAMPESCAPEFVRSVQASFQMQKRTERRVWISIGAKNGNTRNAPGNEEHAFEAVTGPNHAWPDYVFNECVGGKGWLKVRAILMPKVRNATTHQLVDASRYLYPVTVHGSCKLARQSKKLTANYQEEWGGSASGFATVPPSLRQTCTKAGLVAPIVREAFMLHPGSRRGRLQAISTSIEVPAMPEECWGIYQRLSAAVTQIQDPLHHARWYNTSGCRITPKECVGITTPNWYVLSMSRDEGGIAGLYSPPTGHEGKFLYYACTPGKGITHVRLLLRRTIRTVSTHKVIARSRINARPVELRGKRPC